MFFKKEIFILYYVWFSIGAISMNEIEKKWCKIDTYEAYLSVMQNEFDEIKGHTNTPKQYLSEVGGLLSKARKNLQKLENKFFSFSDQDINKCHELQKKQYELSLFKIYFAHYDRKELHEKFLDVLSENKEMITQYHKCILNSLQWKLNELHSVVIDDEFLYYVYSKGDYWYESRKNYKNLVPEYFNVNIKIPDLFFGKKREEKNGYPVPFDSFSPSQVEGIIDMLMDFRGNAVVALLMSNFIKHNDIQEVDKQFRNNLINYENLYYFFQKKSDVLINKLNDYILSKKIQTKRSSMITIFPVFKKKNYTIVRYEHELKSQKFFNQQNESKLSSKNMVRQILSLIDFGHLVTTNNASNHESYKLYLIDVIKDYKNALNSNKNQNVLNLFKVYNIILDELIKKSFRKSYEPRKFRYDTIARTDAKYLTFRLKKMKSRLKRSLDGIEQLVKFFESTS
jgi:hypothetical protein